MVEVDVIKNAEKLSNFIYGKEFEPITQRTPYYHMGATITDSILQAGLNYKNVVYPRVLTLITTYPLYTSTCDFIILMKTIPLADLINWRGGNKLHRIEDLSWFLFDNGVENEDHLAAWLNDDEHVENLLKMSGIGYKTVDYLRMLSGTQAFAIDRHLFSFLGMAGIITSSYQEANTIYSKASELLGISKYELDRKIWLYMSKSGIQN